MKKILLGLMALTLLAGCEKKIDLQEALSKAKLAANCDETVSVLIQEMNDNGFHFMFDKQGNQVEIYLDEDGDVEMIKEIDKSLSKNQNEVSTSIDNNGNGDCVYANEDVYELIPKSIIDDLGLEFDNVCQLMSYTHSDDGKVYEVITFRSNQRHYKFELDKGNLVEYECIIGNKVYEEGQLTLQQALDIAYDITNSDQGNFKIVEQEYDALEHNYEFEGTFNGKRGSVSIYDNGELKQLEWK